MAKVILLRSLNVGQCFVVAETHPKEEGAVGEWADREKLALAKSILAPNEVWKVLGSDGEEVLAENATGEKMSFSKELHVREQARQGFERLRERAADLS